MSADRQPEGVDELPPEEREALAALEHFLRPSDAVAPHMSPDLNRFAALVEFWEDTPAHLGRALPWCAALATGSVLTGALLLAMAPLRALKGTMESGLPDGVERFGKSLSDAYVWPAAGLKKTFRDLAAGATATPGAVAQFLAGEGARQCLSVGRALPGPGAGAAPRLALLLACPGSRGDVQPPMALAMALQRAGWVVRIFIWGKEGDELGMLPRDAGLDVGFALSLGRMYDQIAVFTPGLLLFRFNHLGLAMTLEEQLNISVVEYGFWPEPPDTAYRYSIAVGQRAILKGHLGRELLQGLSKEDIFERTWRTRPLLYGFPEEVVPRQAYWPKPTATSGHHAMGYWVVPLLQECRLRASGAGAEELGKAEDGELEAFLADGPAPVYLGWGSMSVITGLSAESMAPLAVRALRLAGRRGIILGAKISMESGCLMRAGPDADELKAYAKANVLWRRWLPHEWLLPQCSAAVIHGGCGTTAAALRAGLPTVVTPVAVDQFYWATVVARRGVGVGLRELKYVSAEDLAEALQACARPEVVERAAAMGRRLRAEDGVERTVGWLQAYLREARRGPLGGPASSEGG